MGLILDIVNNVVPRVQKRRSAGEDLKSALSIELEKEIAHYFTDQSKSYEHIKNNIGNILTDNCDLDNNEIYDVETGQTICEL
ncbi:MAG: hypothetical protein MR510_08660 [Clostridium sp.]|nr:hypothetical protein [Clostridium sp.]